LDEPDELLDAVVEIDEPDEPEALLDAVLELEPSPVEPETEPLEEPAWSLTVTLHALVPLLPELGSLTVTTNWRAPAGTVTPVKVTSASVLVTLWVVPATDPSIVRSAVDPAVANATVAFTVIWMPGALASSSLSAVSR
jgi:hypothetical protein